jgi:hypothetical protein
MYRDTSNDPDPKDEEEVVEPPAEERPGPAATAPHPAPSKKEVAAAKKAAKLDSK